MKLQTKITVYECPKKIEHDFPIMTIGSCFADNLALKFAYYKFSVLKNPCGVLYNPYSIEQSVRLITENKIFDRDDLFYHEGEWHSFYHHSDFSHHDSDICLQRINTQMQMARSFMVNAKLVVLTLGTAFVYRHVEKNIIVSNCHKITPRSFSRERLGLSQSISCIENIINMIYAINQQAMIIISVSPVRYWVWDAHENQLGKAILLLAIDEIINKYKDVYYFPAYEIMLDELRDYRFYKEDMVHPNNMAVEYIWEIFSSSCCSEDCRLIMDEIEKLQRACAHKVRNKDSEKYKLFCQNQLTYIKQLKKKYPYIDLDNECYYFLNNV